MIQKVPFLDLHAQILPIREEISRAIDAAVDDSDFVLGPRVTLFEEAFAKYCDCKHAIGVNSGTDALHLILRALDIGPGDEVIAPPNMFIAAVEAIVMTGATPVFADVDETTFCLDPDAVRAAVTSKTKAIIPVHLFGLTADMDALMEIAKEKGIYVIEDACQAHGATLNGRKAGSLGHVAAFSFYPTKNLSAMGDGGAVTTKDAKIAERIRSLRHHAQRDKNAHDELGFNSRLDSIQAAVLSIKLSHLDKWNSQRRSLAQRVRDRLSGTEFIFQKIPAGCSPVYHVLAVRHPRRQAVHEQLDRSGIGWGGHIARPIHFQPGYRYLGYGKGALPISEKLCDELVSLPIYPTMTDEQADYVAGELARVSVSV